MSNFFWDKGVEPLLCRITPPCREVARLLSASLEQPLPYWRRVQLRLHFLICIWCQRYGEQLKLLRSLLRRWPDQGGDENVRLTAEARERLARSLQEAETND